MSKDIEGSRTTVPTPDKQHSIVGETYWKSVTVNETYCVLAEAGSGVKFYCIADQNGIKEPTVSDTDDIGRQTIERFEQVDSKKSSKQWVKVATNEIPEPIFGSLHCKIVTMAQSL